MKTASHNEYIMFWSVEWIMATPLLLSQANEASHHLGLLLEGSMALFAACLTTPWKNVPAVYDPKRQHIACFEPPHIHAYIPYKLATCQVPVHACIRYTDTAFYRYEAARITQNLIVILHCIIVYGIGYGITAAFFHHACMQH